MIKEQWFCYPDSSGAWRPFRTKFDSYTTPKQIICTLERILDHLHEPVVMDTDTEFWESPVALGPGCPYDKVCNEALLAATQVLQNMSSGRTLYEAAQELCEEDDAWCRQRNEGLTGTYFHKFTLRPEAQVQLAHTLRGWVDDLMQLQAQIDQENAEVERQRKYRHGLFTIVTTHKNVGPRGGEKGTDGCCDVTLLRQADGALVRMVFRNVFDVGAYSYPKRLERTESALNCEGWTDLEREAAKWISEFLPVDHSIRM